MSQTIVEDLEEEKARLGVQIDDLIIESQTLLQLKMSLGLEVATYRCLFFSLYFLFQCQLLFSTAHQRKLCEHVNFTLKQKHKTKDN